MLYDKVMLIGTISGLSSGWKTKKTNCLLRKVRMDLLKLVFIHLIDRSYF